MTFEIYIISFKDFFDYREVDWMDDQTKVKALEKAQGMVEHIGYPQGRNR